jgi:hypothetical protein
MTPRGAARMSAVFLAIAMIVFVVVRSHVTLRPIENGPVVESWWRGGKLVGRRVKKAGEPVTGSRTDETVVEEQDVGEAPLSKAEPFITFALVPGKDGVRAELGDKTVWVTVDDLLSMQAYDHGTAFMDSSLGIGTSRALLFHIVAGYLQTTTAEVERAARLTRVRFERRVVDAPPVARIAPSDVTPALVKSAIRDAASYLARAVDERGRFRYLVDAPSNKEIEAPYSWPRHAGATFFLAQAAALLDDVAIRRAMLRAATKMRDDTMLDCGAERCIATDDEPDIGSSALALLAFTEIVRTDADSSYRRAINELAKFLRSQQRPDGEMMHLYKRSAKKPVDVQLLYYTGEAALALARAHRITNDPADLESSKRALAHLVGPGWSFFGSRYFWSEEHWTCQAMADLWDRAPSQDAFAFCLRWHQYQRALQHDGTDSPFDADGAFGFGPLFSPRTTPASSRGEAAGATLEIARRLGHGDQAALDDELRRAIAFVLREQFRATGQNPAHLFGDPVATRGAMPGSPVDWQLRIDYEQHAGSMMIRWLSLTGP